MHPNFISMDYYLVYYNFNCEVARYNVLKE